MKKLLLVFGLLLFLATGVSAQRYYHGGGHYYYARPRVSVGIGLGSYYPAYPYYGYSPYFGYPPYGYGFGPGYGYGYGYGSGYGSGYRYSRPTKLDLQIQDIRNDYNERIYQAKHDKNLKRKERKKLVHELETQRDKAIIQAEKDYYEKPPRRHNFSSNNNNSDNN
jgi:hypothetical protein